jgi:hypothetical protein
VLGTRVANWGALFVTDGGYMLDTNGRWMARTPNGHLGNLGNHDVTEHEGGTITVSPSILISNHTGELWHGFLERGVWREA